MSGGALPAGTGSREPSPAVSAVPASIPGADAELIYQALRFSFWAAGEGFCPAPGEDAEEPEEFFWQYSQRTGDDDWETLAERFRLASTAETALGGGR